MLIKLMEKDIGYKPMVACYSGNADHPLKRPQGCEEAPKYARYNITHTLDQVFTAPRLVKHVINDSSNIAAAYVGSAAASWEDFFKDNREIRVLWTPDAQYRRLYSNYNANAQSTQVNPLREVKLFKTDGGGDSENEKQRIEAEMEEKNRQEESLRQKLAELQTILKDRQDKKAEYENQKKKLDAAANAHRNKYVFFFCCIIGIRIDFSPKIFTAESFNSTPSSRLNRNSSRKRKKVETLLLINRNLKGNSPKHMPMSLLLL